MNVLFFAFAGILFATVTCHNNLNEGNRTFNRKEHTSEWLSPLATLHSNRVVDRNDYELWKQFKRKHGKKYKSEKHEIERLKIFLDTLKTIKHHNGLYKEGKKQFELGINHFSDMTFDEYRRLNGYRRSFRSTKKNKSSTFQAPSNVSVPDSFDWRDHGFVTAVKDQGTCGSCYAFSTTGSLEGQHKRRTGQLVSLSEQNIIDCSSKYGNDGCDGGLMDSAFEYVKENHGIDTEKSYPYKGYKAKCHFKKKSVGSLASGFIDLPQGDEETLKIAVATQGPISVAIDADHESFKSFYSNGVYYEEECSGVNVSHAVLVIGYGTHEKYGDYWLVKNSWGEHWGDKGYVRMARNKNNNCGIASVASYPIV